MRLTITFGDRTLNAIRLLCGGAADPETRVTLAAIRTEIAKMTTALQALKDADAGLHDQVVLVVNYLHGIPALIAAAVASANGDAAAMESELSALAAKVTEEASALALAVHDAPAEVADTTDTGGGSTDTGGTTTDAGGTSTDTGGGSTDTGTGDTGTTSDAGSGDAGASGDTGSADAGTGGGEATTDTGTTDTGGTP